MTKNKSEKKFCRLGGWLVDVFFFFLVLVITNGDKNEQ